jgi:glutamine synthetase
MFDNFLEAEEFIKLKQIRMVDLKFCDLWGKWHHVTISTKEFNANLMENGIGFDGSSVGFLNVQSGDMALIPDLSTAFIDIFWDIPTLSFICNTVEADTKVLFRDEPREITRKAEKYLQETQIADQSIWGPEFEFYIFNEVSFQNSKNESRYLLNSEEGLWNSNKIGNGNVNPYHGGYHAIPPKDRYFSVRAKMADNLEKMGVPFKYHHHEVGGPGQQEIETTLLGILKAGDTSMLIKYITKMTAFQENLSITFLPKPLFGEAGNGMHFHQQIRKGKTNIFYDPESENLLS